MNIKDDRLQAQTSFHQWPAESIPKALVSSTSHANRMRFQDSLRWCKEVAVQVANVRMLSLLFEGCPCQRQAVLQNMWQLAKPMSKGHAWIIAGQSHYLLIARLSHQLGDIEDLLWFPWRWNECSAQVGAGTARASEQTLQWVTDQHSQTAKWKLLAQYQITLAVCTCTKYKGLGSLAAAWKIPSQSRPQDPRQWNAPCANWKCANWKVVRVDKLGVKLVQRWCKRKGVEWYVTWGTACTKAYFGDISVYMLFTYHRPHIWYVPPISAPETAADWEEVIGLANGSSAIHFVSFAMFADVGNWNGHWPKAPATEQGQLVVTACVAWQVVANEWGGWTTWH